MKQTVVLIALAFIFAGSVYTQTIKDRKRVARFATAEVLIEKEKQSWELVKQKDLKSFANFLADDFYGIYPDAEGVTKSELLEKFKLLALVDYQLNDFKVTMLNKQAAIISYRAVARVTDNGKEIPLTVALTSGWAKRGGKWFNVFFRESLTS